MILYSDVSSISHAFCFGFSAGYSQAVVSIGAALSAAPPPPGPLLTALGLCFCLVAIVVYVQGIELRLPLTFYSARRGTARASHPVLAKLSGGVDSSSAVELQTLFPMRLSPSGTRQLLFANFWVGLLQAPLSKIGLAGVLGNPWVFAALVFVLEAVSFADATPKQMAEFLALSDAGVRGKSPGIDTERFLALRRSQLKLLNAAFMAGVSLAAVAVDKACTALIGLPLGCLNILLLVSTVLGGARQVDVLTQGAKVDKVIAEEYAVLEQVAQRSR